MTELDLALQRRAAAVSAELAGQDDVWRGGWTRRRFLAGVGMAGVAALGTQLVTGRAAYAATPSSSDRTLVVVFLRGGADGLRILSPHSSALGLDYLKTVRGELVLADADAIALPGTSGWAINAKLRPLYDALWSRGELAFVPGVSTSGVSRSHFQAQSYLERGGSGTATAGWLERTLELMGPGTTFRSVAEGASLPLSLAGDLPSIALTSIAGFTFPGWDDINASSQTALLALYRGLGGPLGEDVPATIAALGTASQVAAHPDSTVVYPDGDFGASLKDLAKILKADVGLQVATVDVGGWDTHTDEVTDLDANLDYAATALRAFVDDLGPTRRSRVTVAVMTEFGRRVPMNDSGGADHGHGSVMWLLGGGLTRSDVFGRWTALSDGTLDDGDVPGVNNPFDVLGELVQKRLNVGTLASVFPGYSVTPLGLASA